MQQDRSVPDLVQTLENKTKAYNIISTMLRAATFAVVVALLVIGFVQTQRIINNQHHNSIIIESFIRDGLVCTATTPPILHPTPATIQAEGQKCFPNTLTK